MRIGMGGRGKAASNAGSSGRHEMTDSTPRTPLIGPDIEARAGGHEAQIMNTKSAREEAFLDTLHIGLDSRVLRYRLVALGPKGLHGRLKEGYIELQVEQAGDRGQQCLDHRRI